MNSFNVGPQVLESLTQGLYEGEAKNSRMYVYREYIQNAADAIDEAIGKGILEPDFGRIDVRTDSKDRKITIADNGVGVSIDEIYVLSNIGASKKDGKNTRGFRGIGRLSGISYCDTLRFTASAYGEDKKTVITYDCKTIRERLKEKDINRQSLESFLENLVAYDTLSEEKDKHYFVVEMFGVNIDTILDKEEVKKYLEQTAPIDFNSQKFFEAPEIKRHFKELGITIPSYKIYFDNIPLYKPYSSVFYKDQIYMIEYVYETASDGSPLFAGWVGFTGLKSVLLDEIGGIRLRKGNILVGDADTFAGYFVGKKRRLKNDRIAANKCFVGEIHVLHPAIYPNSKRDSFEESDNKFYGEMKQKLIQWTEPLDHDYRRGISDVRSALGRFDDTKETGYKGTLKKFNIDVKRLQETQTTLATYLKYNPEFSKQIENGLKKSEEVREKLAESEVRSELHVVSGKRLEPVASVGIDYYKEHILPQIADVIREYLKTNYGGVLFSNIAEELIAKISWNQLLTKQRAEAVKIAI